MKEVPEDKIVVLGLISTKRAHLESQKELITKIYQASQYFPFEQLALSPQCGFSSSVIGNKITIGDQKRKLQVLVEAAKALWN